MRKLTLIIIGIITILIIAGVFLWVKFLGKDKDNKEGFFANLPIVSDLNSVKNKNEQFQSDYYQCTIPDDFNLTSLEEDQKISLQESKAIAISKDPNKGAYPLNYRANIAIYIYEPKDDLFTAGGFDLATVNDFLIQKDNLLSDDEEIEKPLEQKYDSVTLAGQKGKEHFYSASTNKENIFLENNLLVKKNNIIYALSFHDLGKESEVNKNLEIFHEFCDNFQLIK